MSVTIQAAPSGVVWPALRRFGPLAGLLLVTAALGLAGQSAARPVFVLGCAAVAWDAIRFGAGTNFACCFVLFCAAPFLRRVVDLGAGYEASGLMISGPLLALLMPAPRTLAQLGGGVRLAAALRPNVVMCACILWGCFLSVIAGGYVTMASNAIKWAAPPLYGVWIYHEARRDPGVVDAAANAALVTLPIMGLYAFWQYAVLPDWDRFWMSYTLIASIGQPEPFLVRVFSTLNAPAGYATFTAVGLLLFGFRRAPMLAMLAAAPAVLGLMLSLYRTAWVGLGIGMVMGLFHPQSRRRAAMLLLAVPLVGAAVISFTPAGEQLSERLATFGSAASDDSGQERLSEYNDLLQADGGTLIGHGFDTVDVLQAGAKALDGQFIVSWFSFGLVGGMVATAAVIWAAVGGIRASWRTGTLRGMSVAAVLICLLVQLPLAVISASEIGFLFWSFAAIGAAMGAPLLRPPPPAELDQRTSASI